MRKNFYSQFVLALLFMFAMPSILPAQVERNTVFKVAVGDLIYTPKQKKETVGSVLGTIGKAVVLGKFDSQHEDKAEAVRASIVSGFGNVRRFRAIDGLFKKEELADGSPALYVEGTIGNISTTTELFEPSDKKIKPYDVYKGFIEVTVHVKDAHDDHIVNSQTFFITEYDCGWVKSADAAISEALVTLSNKVTKHYNKLFPLSASIIEAGETKKDKQKEVYIDLGEEGGASKGMKFTVYSVKTIGGRVAKKELGTIKVSEVMGDDISLCKVSNGGKNIKEALEGGMTVVAMSYN